MLQQSKQTMICDSGPVSSMLVGTRPIVMGILNLTPDSFSDGGAYGSISEAIDSARHMIDEGADIIDIGGESSRPGSEPVNPDEERRRVMPVIEKLASCTTVPISIDTTKSIIAYEAVLAGAAIVNDISALMFDADMVRVIRESDAHVVLMHMLGTPRIMQNNPTYHNVVEEVYGFLSNRVDYAIEAGIKNERIIIDPGIGFGKTLAHNLSLLHSIARILDIGYPVLVGASRKGMIGAITGSSVTEREFGTAAVVAHCVLKGVKLHRVHNVRAMRHVCDVAAAIRDEV